MGKQWEDQESDEVKNLSDILKWLKKLKTNITTLVASANSGWTDSGSSISLTTATDTVQIQSQLTVGGNATAQGKLLLLEDSDNGAHSITIQPPASLAASYTLTLPVDDGTSGQVLSTDGSGVTSWITGGGGGGINGVRVVTAAGAITVTTSDINKVVIANKTVGAATAVSLYATPTAGDVVVIKDGKGDALANNITITPNAGNIDDSATYVMNQNYQSAMLIYDGTQWRIF